MPSPKHNTLSKEAARWRAKYIPWVITQRIKRVVLHPPTPYEPPTELELELFIEDLIEQECTVTLEILGIVGEEVPFYIGYAKRLWAKAMKFSGVQYENERDVLTTEYVTRGWNKTVMQGLWGIVDDAKVQKQNPDYPLIMQSKFHAYLQGANLSCPPGVFTQVPFNAKLYDGLDEYDESGAHVFTPLQAGYYIIAVGIRWATVPVTIWLETVVNVNDTEQVFSSTLDVAVAGDHTPRMCFLVHLNMGDAVKVLVQPYPGGTRIVQALTYDTCFQAHRLS